MGVVVRSYKFPRGPDPELVKNRIRSKHPGALVQTAKAEIATNSFFLEMLAAQTLRASATDNLLADKPEIDFLLRLARTTQISRAIADVGARKGEAFLLVVADPRRKLGGLGEAGGKELPRSGLSDAELDGVEEAALLNARRG